MKSIIAIAAAALVTAGAVQAQPFQETRSVRVAYADLDLSNDAGRSALERRVGNAVKQVCPDRPSPPELTKLKIYKTCVAKAWESVRPQLASLYSGRELAQAAIRVGAAN
jgi:UrcA family protein